MSPSGRMPRPPAGALSPAIAKLSRLSPLEDEAVGLLNRLDRLSRHPGGAALAREGEAPPPGFLISGWAARVRRLPDGRRQILGLLVPGDALGLSARIRPLDLCDVVALTPAELVGAGAMIATLNDEARPLPGLAEAVHLSLALDEQRLLDQIMRLGRRNAAERICDLLLELRDRLAFAGQGDERRFPMPLTQEAVADVTALSIVHVNRVLQQLRREGLLELRNGEAQLHRPELLAERAGRPPPRGAPAPRRPEPRTP